MSFTIESVRAFNGLDVLVALDEGLFSDEGLNLSIATRPPGEGRDAATATLTRPSTAQGQLLERGEAAMFQG